MDSLGVLLDYHCCPFCGFEELTDAPGGEGEAVIDGEHGPDRACGACGTAVFIDPVLIWPGRSARADVA